MQRDYHDLWGGAAMTATGAAVALYCLGHYDFGTMRQMGPGFFPVVLGAILAGLGLLIAIPAWFRAGVVAPFAALDAVVVLAAIAIFGFGLTRLGLVTSTASAVLIASLAAPRGGWLWRIILALVITVLTWVIFKQGLQMTIPVWPDF
ncbi:tripartite tricarboxylate transporter TctB family protein [Paracoccus sp. 11-3]|uniref:Tripartite tricarboxylate transporter TctB family protein n=1 Tax=Paracoccus amoyensis TaxID=2760093 RepID=A0A926JBH2_9RHOB|nr:tripartite tricarboxylate transporter TctB family protein [Paracoccus amoyensis]MBC9247106.1 tripartite tricarboxylate transporter TctB family protein [Paracoccus amoyensis]